MKKNESYEEFIKGIWRDNPVFVQVLGMCPMLAVTNSAINAIAMGMATFFVLVGSSFLVSSFRNWIPKQVRISCFIIIIATFVTVADYTVMDAMGMATGFLLALFSLGAIREILGDGALFGVSLFGENFEPWIIMILPPGGFLTLGVILLFFNWFKFKKDEFLADVADAQRSSR